MIPAFDIHELNGDAYAICLLAQAALQNMVNAQLFANLAEAQIFSFELERGSTTRHVQVLQMYERVDNLLRNTVTEIFLIRVVAHIDKGKYSDRLYSLFLLKLPVYIETGIRR